MLGYWIGFPRRVFRGLLEIMDKLLYIIDQNERIIDIMTTTQADIDALTAQVTKGTEEVKTEVAKLEAQIAAGQTLDLSGLKGAVQGLDDLNLDAPAPAPEPTPALETPAEASVEPTLPV